MPQGMIGAAAGLLMFVGLAHGVFAAQGLFPLHLSENTTGFNDLIFLGPPGHLIGGLAGETVIYDLGKVRVIDGPGADFNVYESQGGTQEFSLIDVLVSANGSTFISVKRSEAAMVRIGGDEQHETDANVRSYDLSVSGLSAVRFIRIDGKLSRYDERGTLVTGGWWGFDLDAVGAIHFSAPRCNGRRATIVGTEESDILIGTDGDDVIVGLGGSDSIDGRGGNDVICGNDGDDTINGGDGRDILFGNAGNDGLDGGIGNDTVDGGSGDDLVGGGLGHDKVYGGSGNDLVVGNEGDDRLDGGAGNDKCDGGLGTDTNLGECETLVSIP